MMDRNKNHHSLEWLPAIRHERADLSACIVQHEEKTPRLALRGRRERMIHAV